jgi:hypothetical protein
MQMVFDWQPGRLDRTRLRADRRPPRVLPASGQWRRQHEQHSGARLRHADRLSRHHRLRLDHRQSQQQHDADAAIKRRKPL